MDKQGNEKGKGSAASGDFSTEEPSKWEEIILDSGLINSLLTEITVQKRNETIPAAQDEIRRLKKAKSIPDIVPDATQNEQAASNVHFVPIQNHKFYLQSNNVATSTNCSLSDSRSSSPQLPKKARRPSKLKIIASDSISPIGTPRTLVKPYLRSKHSSGNEEADREVAAVLAGAHTAYPRRYTSPLKPTPCSSLSSSPSRPGTVMTNVSRGNMIATTPLNECSSVCIFQVCFLASCVCLLLIEYLSVVGS